jgi:hypothetical protein
MDIQMPGMDDLTPPYRIRAGVDPSCEHNSHAGKLMNHTYYLEIG